MARPQRRGLLRGGLTLRATSLRVPAAYHQYTLEWAAWDPDAIRFKGGNGLVWKSEGRIVVLTGVDSGDISVEFGTDDSEPPLDLNPWDEVVEVSAAITSNTVSVFAPDGIHIDDVELPPDRETYRLRVHARGRDSGHEAEFTDASAGEHTVEEHMIHIWPAPPSPETRLKLTDSVGAVNRAQK